MKREVNAFDYAGQICKALPQGVLLTTKDGEKVNSMTIGWGHIGVEWRRPVFVVYVRSSRYTRELLDKNREFTVNIPVGEVDREIISVCGTDSGRDVDKIEKLGLTLVASDHVAAPGIKELPLTLECRVIYKHEQKLEELPWNVKEAFYPGRDRPHTAYYGEIVGAYLIEE